jgi:ribosomal protein S15P/S13E
MQRSTEQLVPNTNFLYWPKRRKSITSAVAKILWGNVVVCITYSILNIFSAMAPSLPEDLYHLIKKAVSVRKHLERNRKVCFACALPCNVNVTGSMFFQANPIFP